MDDEHTDEPADDPAPTAVGVPAMGPTGEDGPRTELEGAVVTALEELLLTGGPDTLEALADQLAEARPDLSAELLAGRPREALVEQLTAVARQADELWRLPDGRLAPVLHHLRRATFTHRLSGGEVERAAIDLSPDLIALAVPRAVALDDGTALRTAGPGDDPRAAGEASLLGPPGWLRSFAADDVVAVGYDGERVRLERCTPAGFDESAQDAAAEALAQAFAELAGGRAPEVHRLVIDAIGNDTASFAVPVAPVSELLASVGIEVREAWAGPAGQPWTTPAEDARRRRADELLAGADNCCRRAARRSLDAWHEWLRTSADGPAPASATGAADAARIADDLDHGPAAAVLAEVATIGRPLVSVQRLGEWADAVSAGKATAGGAYLRALGADAAGDGPSAEARLAEGLALAPGHPACLGLMAELAQDRGDAPRAVELLRQAGRPPGPDVQRELEPFVPSHPPGRNEPCPCGSGRKFKACCTGRPIRRPLVDRSRWLLAKASRHAQRTDQLTLQSLRHLFEGGGAADPGGLVNDMLLFACRGLERYVDVRGALLPADELDCARGWVGQPMRLLAAAGDAGPEPTAVTDLRTGDRLTLADGALASALGPDDAGLARALPVDDVWLLSSVWLPIPAPSRQRALDLLDAEVRPFHLLHLLVDLQVDALRA